MLNTNVGVLASALTQDDGVADGVSQEGGSSLVVLAGRLAQALPSKAVPSVDLSVLNALKPRPMRDVDLPAAHALSVDEKWPHRLEDWTNAMALGQGLVISESDQLKGVGMTWNWGTSHATLGLVIVRSDARGKGLAKQLMAGLLEPLEGRSVLLHATEQGKPIYAKLGFEEVGKIVQYQGILDGLPDMPLPEGMHISQSSDLTDCSELDQRATGCDRLPLLQQLATQGRVFQLEFDNKKAGFVVVRPFGRGHVVGPVVANHIDEAKALILHALGELEHSEEKPFVRLDVRVASGLDTWLSELGLKHAGGAVAMVKGALPQTDPLMKSWALVSQSLG